MKRGLWVVNLVLLAAAVFSGYAVSRLWDKPCKIDMPDDATTPVQASTEKALSFEVPAPPPIEPIVAHNLFRQEREGFAPPPPEKTEDDEAGQVRTVERPPVQVRGVYAGAARRVAFLTGTEKNMTNDEIRVEEGKPVVLPEGETHIIRKALFEKLDGWMVERVDYQKVVLRHIASSQRETFKMNTVNLADLTSEAPESLGSAKTEAKAAPPPPPPALKPIQPKPKQARDKPFEPLVKSAKGTENTAADNAKKQEINPFLEAVRRSRETKKDRNKEPPVNPFTGKALPVGKPGTNLFLEAINKQKKGQKAVSPFTNAPLKKEE